MSLYAILLLLGAAPADGPAIVREIHSKPAPLWERSKGLVDDRPTLGYSLDEPEARPSLDYDMTGLGTCDKRSRDREEAAFEEAVDMAKDAREELGLDLDVDPPE